MSELMQTPCVDTQNMVNSKPQTRQTLLRQENYPFFGIASGLYALFYTFCMYRNAAGITFPFFIAGSLFFFCLCMKKLETAIKKDSVFYMAGMILLGLSTVCTADGRIIFFNHVGVLLLMISFLLHQFYQDGNWRFGRYLLSVLATMFGAIGEIAKPFTDYALYRSKGVKKNPKLLYVAIGLCIMIPLFLVVWFLLMTADRIFMDLTERFFDTIDAVNIFGVVCSIVLMFLLSYGVLAYLSHRYLEDEVTEKKKHESILAVTITLPLTLLYMVFCGVQVFCLFLGNVSLTNMTYAEYARQGFFQLLFICILNLAMVLIGGHYFKESRVLKIVLTAMSVCTYVMIFSSGYRMILYIQHYYLTFLRILVLWALGVIFLLLTGVLIHIYAPRFPLFRYGVAVVTVCYIVLSFSKPDHLIATCNLANTDDATVHGFFDADAYHDYGYLSGLSADAAPVVLPYLKGQGYDMTATAPREIYRRHEADQWGYFYMDHLREDVEKNGIRTFNFSRWYAGRILESLKK